MSTSDVPGARAANNDELAVGCWAEYEKDGSLILVEGTEAHRVIFVMFDMRDKTPTEYRTAMSVGDFERQFSWQSKDPDSIQWTWHDKTPFPWDRLMGKGVQPGPRPATAAGVMSMAARVAKSMKLRGVPMDTGPLEDEDFASLSPRAKVTRLMKQMQETLDGLPDD